MTQTPTSALSSKKMVLALVAAGVMGGIGATAFNRVELPASHAQTLAAPNAAPAAVTAFAPAALAPVAQPAAAQSLPSFSAITRENGPAVVNISVRGTQRVGDDGDAEFAQGDIPPQLRDFLRQFGGVPGVPGQRGGAPREVPSAGQGSGFIVSSDGLILTNAHVVRGGTEVTVKLTDRREYKAKVLGSDPKTDVAVLKIEASNLPVVRLGSSKQLEVGEWVLAIGAPFGFENSVTAGVVSAKGRSLPDETFVPFLQTDVAVNPGNSGGPLFNTRGEVVGINSQIYSRTGGYQGLSFAIPIEVASRIQEQIVKNGKVEHARLGVVVQEVNQALADSFKLAKPEGALVANVENGSAAAQAGLKAGDVITHFNGQAIVSSGDLPAMVGLSAPGSKAQLSIIRQGQAQTLDATLGAFDEKGKVTKAANAPDESAASGRLGLALRELTPKEQGAAGGKGLVVQQSAGAAALAGVQPGDVILAVNGHPVTSVAQVRDIVKEAKQTVALLISRRGEQIFVPVRLG